MRKCVASIFDYSAVMMRPWADAGYECYCVDIQHPPGETVDGNIIKVGADVFSLNWPWEEFEFVSFFPPCTDVAVSGARWMKDKGLGALIDALRLFQVSVEMAEKAGCPYMIENPVNTVSTYWREPDFKFNPNDYGDPYTKETWLWTGGGFVMPPAIKPGDLFDAPTWVEPTDGSKMHLVPPGPDQKNIRSETPAGFAKAVFEANAPCMTGKISA